LRDHLSCRQSLRAATAALLANEITIQAMISSVERFITNRRYIDRRTHTIVSYASASSVKTTFR
jgi:hypothetical protein